ncbi:hypothetical protein D6D22_07466 [Aureobasidium pullulans]|uniref:F-box domain-containing protein n=1 Tax=Aureobasidium pullulans TaxID=5580 RepID=A0A4S8XG79_AURPU|nr:hypothetical protein D6D22_07466 [Aureobasidium pullulans]
MYMLSNDRLLARSQEPAPIRKRLRQRPDDESTAHPADILELPSELMNIIMTLIIDDAKALSSTRATCRLLKQITQHDFCRIHITESKNLSTTKALERLFWTSLQPSLAPWISSITVDFHNKHLLLSNVLKATDVPGIVDFHIKDDAPLSLALVNLKNFGNKVSVKIMVSKKPSDMHSSVNIVTCAVLCHILLRSEPELRLPCRNVVLEFHSPPCLEWTIWEINHEDMSERYKLIWDQMLTSKAVDEILIKFVQREAVEQSPFHIPSQSHVLKMASTLYSLEMEDCSICDYDLEPMLTNPNLKNLRLHDIDLSPYTGNYRAHLPDRWPKMLGLIASTTDLQSCPDLWSG